MGGCKRTDRHPLGNTVDKSAKLGEWRRTFTILSSCAAVLEHDACREAP
jgi:hypothetical protein